MSAPLLQALLELLQGACSPACPPCAADGEAAWPDRGDTSEAACVARLSTRLQALLTTPVRPTESRIKLT